MSEEDVRALAHEMYTNLKATAERPLPATANRWLGEAQAAAGDATGEDVPLSVIKKRAGQVEELLAHVEETGDDVAEGHIEAAKEAAVKLQRSR